MIYRQSEPIKELQDFIKSFWWIDSEGDAKIKKEKIIPDGYPELIFHYGDPYKIYIDGSWQLQGKSIIAGQIKNYFHLENTGISKMFAIKFQPWTPMLLFQLEMYELTNKVIDIPNELEQLLLPIQKIAMSELHFEEKVSQIASWFLSFITDRHIELTKKELAVDTILQKNGLVNLKEIQHQFEMSERSLERYFKTHIGLSPKFYSRIIRFSHIFQLTQEDNIDWQDIVYKAGYYDQSHFIKNFQEFTGEEPSRYGFSTENMANFFLKK